MATALMRTSRSDMSMTTRKISDKQRMHLYYRSSWAIIILIIMLMTCMELCRHEVDAANIHRIFRRSVRLCSRNLSDAMYILCKDRGFNDPSLSDEAAILNSGVVEECCYEACTFEQMVKYCRIVTGGGPNATTTAATVSN